MISLKIGKLKMFLQNLKRPIESSHKIMVSSPNVAIICVPQTLTNV
jgi:hypothetical protein